MKKGTLADKISSLLTTTPDEIDPEDDYKDDTTAKLNTEYSQENGEENNHGSKFRKDNIDLLADVDERYAGKKGSRRNLNPDDSSEFSESGNDMEESESDSSNEGQEELEDDENGSNESEKSNDDDESAESDQEYDDHSDNTELEDTSNFETLKTTDVSTQAKKGLCVKNQMHIWESLLEMRIQVQKCLLAANKMPNYERYKEIKKESGQDFSTAVEKTKNSVSTLLDKFLCLQDLVWKKYPETKKLTLSNKKAESYDPDDEEIPSDTEDEADADLSEDENEERPKKRLKIADFENDLQLKHNLYKDYRNSVIKKWHEKTRMPVLKNTVNNHSIIQHIEHSLGDRDKLIKRTRLKRSDYKIIGEDSSSDNEEESKQEKPTEEYNCEIFDDDDFYHQLLRELIEFKSSSLTDPVQLGRQWVQLQNLRSKMKRKIDTKATKGRKIRYAVHTKLVNFMAPIDDNLWTDEAKTELFGSVFGKTQATSL
ncbi:protein AATF-like [Diabrotica undecimpunctata]|uniref:protein AATF-like n=1 Tax=Diabrotica undecimpunctata TaxID=50387 RepID=UPI003B63D075